MQIKHTIDRIFVSPPLPDSCVEVKNSFDVMELGCGALGVMRS